jgi:hypothetical protein
MADQHEALRKTLSELQAQLAAIHSVDPQVAQDLQQTIEQARGVLAAQAGQARAEQHQTVVGQLQNAVLRLEVEHPTLAGSVGSLIDALGQIGI